MMQNWRSVHRNSSGSFATLAAIRRASRKSRIRLLFGWPNNSSNFAALTAIRPAFPT
jgi:hypothetical protein